MAQLRDGQSLVWTNGAARCVALCVAVLCGPSKGEGEVTRGEREERRAGSGRSC